MNTACLGLGLLLTDVAHLVSTRGSPEEQERFETLTDVNTACTTAVEILNDLLTFEKLESGILELHKETVPAMALVKECITMFTVHARSKDIEVVPVFNIPLPDTVPVNGSGSSVVRALSDTDTVWMDRFKLAQVLRNLLSNALKFTPQGGHVQVKAYVKVGRGEEEPSKVEIQQRLVRIIPPMFFMGNKMNKGKGKGRNVRVAVDDATHASVAGEQQQSDEGYFVVEVIDSGAGISKENQSKLFREVSAVHCNTVRSSSIAIPLWYKWQSLSSLYLLISTYPHCTTTIGDSIQPRAAPSRRRQWPRSIHNEEHRVAARRGDICLLPGRGSWNLVQIRNPDEGCRCRVINSTGTDSRTGAGAGTGTRAQGRTRGECGQ